jgi:lipoprotein-releasing system permease protein
MKRGLPFPLLLALRYLKSTRQDAFSSFLSAVAAGGIATGVAALLLALGALSGFQRALRGEILARTPQLEIELPPPADARRLAADLARRPGVRRAQVVVPGRGWIVERGKAQPVEALGFAGELPAYFPEASGRAEGLYVGDALAAAWGLRRGDAVEIVSPRPTLSPLGPQPRVRRLRVAGTFRTGRTEQRERVALPLEVAEGLFGADRRRVVAATGDLDGALDLAEALRAELPAGTVVRTWEDLNRPLFFALRLEKSVMFAAVALVVLVAALALVADLALIISSKRQEIGMLGAMGAAPETLRRAFLLLGTLLAGIGVALGAGLGLGAAWALDRWRVLRLPGRAYFLDYVPFAVGPEDLVATIGLTLALAVGSSFWAARRLLALQPVEALRR